MTTPASDYAFARLGPDDLDQLLALERLCFSHPWTERQFLLGLENKAFYVFGLKLGQELAAYCSFHAVADEMEVLNIAVAPPLRRRGLARRLLGLVLQICRNMGIQQGYLEVRRSNTAARALYKAFGFAECGVRKAYYPDNGEDAVLMRLDLPERTTDPNRPEAPAPNPAQPQGEPS
ncbi:MAG: ribosomal protein S18-alanine N-acetyltransferase [Thermodesulfobacteriota bacterium]